MHRSIFAVLAGTLLCAALAHSAQPALLGFVPSGVAAQTELEARFDSLLDAEEIGRWIERLSARPHPVGSPYGKENAEYLLSLFRSWGWQAEIEQYEVLFPTPKSRLLELLEPGAEAATLAEGPVAGDATAGQTAEQLPSYNAYSIDGDVTGELVFVNYGVPEDYLELDKRGISVEGKIVLARYYGSWRGIKPKVAAERGAIGCLMYTDPEDDGYFQGDVYPTGGFRPPQGVQRGSVADMPLFPGDPLTPGIGATPDAVRLALDEAPTLTKIPVLPISYADARPLLAALRGPVAPEGWRGALPITYHLGPGPAKVHLALEFDWSLHTAYNVIAKLPGDERAEQWIVRGNHHDAWVNGATDPVSGLAATLAEAKALGELYRAGWRPKRTIVYAAWDAEEPGLLGSTEWVEHHAAELSEHAAVYINSDSNSRGFLSVGGSHTLERLVNEVARDVTDPQTGKSVQDRARAAMALFGSPKDKERALADGDLPISALGSGSDYSPFLQHLGIASLNVGFGGEGDYGQYHSIYDSFDHYRRFMDSDFSYGVALAQVNGRLVMRLANADRLPFEFAALASAIGGYVDEVEELAAELRQETEEENERIAKGFYELAWDPRDEWRVPAPKESVPFLNFAPLRNALSELERSAERFEQARDDGRTLEAATASKLDRALYLTERALIRETGLPRRSWYKHHVYAPGFYTGYGVKTLPGIREAIEERTWPEAEEQIGIAAEVLQSAAAAIDRAAEFA
ncbi:MAG: M28 family peptidase, partial [Acidobacteria bacterium]|nr:M28 family peptidase [Acidobacteriota bacterium]